MKAVRHLRRFPPLVTDASSAPHPQPQAALDVVTDHLIKKIIMKTRILVLIAASLACTSAHAADPANGKRLSERWCDSCHVVSPNQRRANVDVPSFAAISRQANLNAARLALFLLAPHPPLPDMALSRTEAADIASYIRSLGSAK